MCWQIALVVGVSTQTKPQTWVLSGCCTQFSAPPPPIFRWVEPGRSTRALGSPPSTPPSAHLCTSGLYRFVLGPSTLMVLCSGLTTPTRAWVLRIVRSAHDGSRLSSDHSHQQMFGSYKSSQVPHSSMVSLEIMWDMTDSVIIVVALCIGHGSLDVAVVCNSYHNVPLLVALVKPD